ncbi:bifunctional UDP-sugar hydrolase/5'-nucleotidase UshA [Vibrio ulleungensis]|uniref:Bifunctional UDP-sugar hydrolase/5'-nucleotidase n=1 Tax=Vibrio ulleungensis TaxID=2807619 RepID=A0ABS2HIB8_9VIBR|nr:bifunctional UDP-sugar hydrolase/5'-nucleotidase UshA [Vibrio ulleungensis]MBM7036381.1 bifunctional UDP-sugar hydrolase/5'-nucleotidase [Vibrio ulleungensis]
MKEHKFLKTAVASMLLATLAGCASQGPAWEEDKTYQLTVLHTNDHHGRFWHNKYGEYGMAARKTLIDSIRAEVAASGGEVLLLSGGDINTGVPESDLLDAEPDFKGMTMIGYDAMAIGNHEFDNPLHVLDMQMGWADFPMLSANIYDKETGERKYQAYQVFEKQGIKIAVVGFTTADTWKIGNPEYIGGLEFRAPEDEAKVVLAEIEANEQADLVFAVTHMGHFADGKHGGNAPGDVTLARSLEPGQLDLIVGGHSQEPVCMEGENRVADFSPGDECKPDQQNGTWIVQAHEWGKYVGRADYEFRNGELSLVSYDLIPVNLKKKIKVDGESQRVFIQDEIAADAEMQAFLQPYQDKGQAELNVTIGTINDTLVGERAIVRSSQTNLGRLIATAHMERAKADFAVMNSGGVRASIATGDVTYKDVLTVQPFANALTYTDMSGKEVLEYLTAVATKEKDSGAFAQFAGVSLTVSNGQISDVLIGGMPVDMAKTYRFTVPSFNASGGDGYPKVTGHPGYVNTGFVDAEVLKEFIETNSPIDVSKFEPMGEITYK